MASLIYKDPNSISECFDVLDYYIVKIFQYFFLDFLEDSYSNLESSSINISAFYFLFSVFCATAALFSAYFYICFESVLSTAPHFLFSFCICLIYSYSYCLWASRSNFSLLRFKYFSDSLKLKDLLLQA